MREVLDGGDLRGAGVGDLVGGLAGAVERGPHLVPDQRHVAHRRPGVAQPVGQSPARRLDLASGCRQRQRGVVHDLGEPDPEHHPEHEQHVAEHLAGTTNGAVGVELHAGILP